MRPPTQSEPAPPEATGNGAPNYIEIGGRSTRNIVGIISYVLLFGGVCGVLVFLFVRFLPAISISEMRKLVREKREGTA